MKTSGRDDAEVSKPHGGLYPLEGSPRPHGATRGGKRGVATSRRLVATRAWLVETTYPDQIKPAQLLFQLFDLLDF